VIVLDRAKFSILLVNKEGAGHGWLEREIVALLQVFHDIVFMSSRLVRSESIKPFLGHISTWLDINSMIPRLVYGRWCEVSSLKTILYLWYWAGMWINEGFHILFMAMAVLMIVFDQIARILAVTVVIQEAFHSLMGKGFFNIQEVSPLWL
jgi:hypothetical protein